MTDTLIEAVQMCQAVTGGSDACANAASEVLEGFYLCQLHVAQWTRRWARGERNRIHPSRVELVPTRAQEMRVCGHCKQERPAHQFFQTTKTKHCKVCQRTYMREYCRKKHGQTSSAGSEAEESDRKEALSLSRLERLGSDAAAPSTSASDPADDVADEPLSLVGRSETAQEGAGVSESSPPDAFEVESKRMWQCSHDEDQWGGKICVRCCDPKPGHYVWRKPAGGSPGAWRWLCGPCYEVYCALGLVDQPPNLLAGQCGPIIDHVPKGQTRTELGRFSGLRVVA